MVEKIKKIYNQNYVEMFYIILPIVEVITTFMITKWGTSLTLGVIYKTVFLLYCFTYLIFVDEKRRGINTIFILLFGITIAANIITTVDNFTIGNMVKKLTEISKYICFPVAMLFLYKYILNGNKVRLITLAYSATIYATVMAIAGITGTALPTYDSFPEFGQSGWFYSGNEISVLMAMFYPIVIYFASKYKKIGLIFATAIMTYGLLEIGTKTSFMAIILTVVATLIFSIYRYLKTKLEIAKNMLIISCILLITVAMCSNISPSLKFIAERIEIAKNKAKGEGSDKNVMVNNLLFNGREDYVKEQMQVYKNAGVLEKMVGIKDINKVKDETGNHVIIERDSYDILIKYGILGLIIYFVPILIILFMFTRKVYFNFKKEVNEKNYIISISIAMALGVSYIAGHVLLAPTVAIFLAVIFSKLNQPDDMELFEIRKKIKEKNTNRKPTMYITLPKLSVGGMEKSCINLLNLSDYTKHYDVTLVIGYIVDRELLGKLPDDIEIKILCKGRWNIFGKIIAGMNAIGEHIKFCFNFNKYNVSICYSHHHSVLAQITRKASNNNIGFVHNDLQKARTKKQIAKMKFEKFNKIVCVSNASRQSFLEIFPKYIGKVVVINNYIDGEKILELAAEDITEENIIKQLEVEEKTTIFINICRHLESAKKVSRILESSKKLKEEGYNFVVWLIGDGEDNSSYREYVEENYLSDTVIFFGKQINPYKYLKKADVFVFSSEFEGYGMVLDEARILGKDIITTDVADAKYITEDGYGILCENSLDGVYNGMKEYLDKGYTSGKKFDYKEFNTNITNALNDIALEVITNKNKKRVMFISSVGGHLTQLLELKSLFTDYNYVLVTEDTDVTKGLKEKYNTEYLVYGSRQYLFAYIFKTIYNTLKSIILFLKYRPKVIVTTGTHTAVPMCYIGRIFGAKVIFIESFAKRSSPTLSGKMVYPIATIFVVQWESMLEFYPKAKYWGRIY